MLDDNTRLSGDLFIDCSGEMSVLIGDPALAADCSWAADSPVDFVINFSIHYGPERSTLRPLTSIQAIPWSWQRIIQLRHRLDLFRHRGRIGAYEYDVISDQLWAAFFLGLNCWPERYDIMTDALAEKELLQQHQNIRQAVQKTVDAMPNHHEVLARYCPAR